MVRRTMGKIEAKLVATIQLGQRWAKRRPLAINLGVAILAFGIALAELTSDALEGARAADWIGVVLLGVSALALVWRRSATVPMALVVSVVLAIVYAREYSTYVASIGLPAVFAVAAYVEDRRRAWLLSLVMTASLFASASLTVIQVSGVYNKPDATSMLLTIIGAIAAGFFVRNRAELVLSTQARAERAEADRLAEAQRAVTRERLRIAREMHDVVAHGMSVMAVQASAAQQIVHAKPERAVELMASIEATGRESLTEMRRMLGVLRTEGDGEPSAADLAPQPTLDDVETLVTSCSTSGIPTTLSIGGERRSIGAGLELAAFRVVQEALTNVLKHGGSAATAEVQINFGVDELSLAITDTGSGVMVGESQSPTGNGLVGMRERVEIYHGTITTGPRQGGGFGIEASLPLKPHGHRSVHALERPSTPPESAAPETAAPETPTPRTDAPETPSQGPSEQEQP